MKTDTVKQARGFLKDSRFNTKTYLAQKQEDKELENRTNHSRTKKEEAQNDAPIDEISFRDLVPLNKKEV